MSKIKSVELGQTFNIYYKDTVLERSDANVIFSIWNSDGVSLVSNAPPTAEIPDTGVYYYTMTAPNSDTYLICWGTDGENDSPNIIRVGNPTPRVFYWEGTANSTIRYEAFTESEILRKGIMNYQEQTGMYWTEIEFPTPWYVEIKNRRIVKSTAV